MLALTEQVATLKKFTPIVEMHGKDPVPGAALTIEFNVTSSFLVAFHPELRAFLYCKHGAKSHDLADSTAELPDIRFEKMKPPYIYRQQVEGSTLTIHIGDREDNAIVLDGKVKKPWKITPMQGGTCVVAMTFHCHPDQSDIGTIYSLQRQEVRISFDAGTEVTDDGGDDGGEE